MSISQDWLQMNLKNTELEALHRSPSVEYSFYTAVRAGDMETVIQNCNEDSFLHLEGTGVLSRNPVTNLKYHLCSLLRCLPDIALTEGWRQSRPTGSVIFTF